MKNLILIYTFITLTISGCFFQADEVTPTDTLLGEQNAAEFAKQREANGVKITQVQISGNQFQVTGSNLNGAKVARLKGPNGLNMALPIESKSPNSLVLDISQNLQMITGTIFQLIINDAYGASSFQLTLTVQDGTITNAKIVDNTIDGKKLAQMGASEGDVLSWNNTDNEWEPRALSGQNFVGTWDETANAPQLVNGGYFSGPAPSTGDYLIVTNSGNSTMIDGENGWTDGDWIIFNGTAWERVEISGPTVSTFNGSSGAITFDYPDLDFSTSTIDDFNDVDTSTFTPTNGQVLKWDGSNWVPATDNDAGGAGSVDSTTIADGAIVDADISNLAGISQAKVAGLTGALNGKFSANGGALAGNLNMSNNDITNVANATVANLTVTGNMDYTSNSGNSAFVNTTDDNNAANALVLRRMRADAGSVTGTDFGAALSFEAEGSTNGVSAPQATVLATWEGSQSNNTTDRDASLIFATAKDNSVTEAMRINSDGYVGIGTNDPTQKLDIKGSDEQTLVSIINSQSTGPQYPGVNMINLDGTGQGGYPRVQGYNVRGSEGAETNTQDDDIFFQLATGGFNGATGPFGLNEAAVISFEATENFTAGSTPGRIVFKTTASGDTHNPQNRMVIDQSGNVGIGTVTDPTERLEVNGRLKMSSDGVGSLAGSNELVFYGTTNIAAQNDQAVIKSSVYTPNSNGGNLEFYTSDTSSDLQERMMINGAGNVGIGTNTPASKLEVEGGLTQALTGTVTVINGNATIVGAGTDFSTTGGGGEVEVGQSIKIGNRVYTVTSVDNDINIDVTPTPGAGDVVAGVTAYEMGSENIFEVKDGDGNSIMAASPAGVTFGQGVSATSTANNDAAVITANADGGTDSILLQNNSTELMEVKSTGDVEIGNVDFGQDTGRTTVGIGDGSGNTALVMGADSNNKAQIETSSSGTAISISTKTSGTDYNNTLYLNQGRVGVNTSSTAAGRMVIDGDTAVGLHVKTQDQNYVQLQLRNDTYNSNANIQVMDNGNLNVSVPDNGTTAGELNISTDQTTRVTVDNAGLVGIGGVDPDTQLHVRTSAGANVAKFERNGAGSGVIGVDAIVGAADVTLEPDTNGSGTVLRYKTAGGTVTDGLIVDETGNVGVGVDPTTDKLQVAGTFSTTGAALIGGNTTVDGNVILDDGTAARSITMTDRGTAGNAFDLTIQGSDATTTGTGGDININPGSGAAAADGRVIISKGNPAGTADANATLIVQDDAANGIQFLSPNNVTSSILFGDTDANNVGQINYDHTNQKLEAVAENNFGITVNGSESLKIDSAGEVGIGTTGAPDALLDVESATPSIMITDDDNTASQAAFSGLLEFRDSANTQVGQAGYVNSDQNLLLRNFVATGDVDIISNGGSIKLQADGQVGIGSTSPETQMVVSGGTLCVGSDADCDGNNDIEGQIHAALLCDETGANCADISVGLATDINTLGDASVKTTSLYLGNGAGVTDTGSATSKNLGVGQTALTTVGAGEQNVAIGYGAGDTISGGDDNIAIGVTALDAVSNGSKNVGVGTGALRTNVSGASNVAIGYDAGVGANADSSRSIFIGESAGPSPSAAVDDAIAIGHAAEADADGAIAIGSGAVAGNNQTVIGHSATAETHFKTGDVGIGLSGSPEAKLHVQDGGGATVNDIAVISAFGNSGVNRGAAILFRTPGAASAVKGARISAIQEGGTALAFSTSPDYLDTEPVEHMRVGADGNVGIDNTTPGENFVVGNTTDLTTDRVIEIQHNGVANKRGYRISSDGGENWLMGNTGSGTDNFGIYDENAGNIPFKIFNNAPSYAVVIDSDDSVGIFNSNPATALHVGDAPSAGEATITNNVLRLEGNSIEDGAASGSYDGTFGVLHFGANNDIGGFIERQYVLTNAYQGGSFAILQSTGVVQPTVTTTTTAGDTVTNGEAVLFIDNGGTVQINTTNGSAPTKGLIVDGEIESTTGGIRFPDGSIMTSAGSGSAGSVSSNGDSVVAANADGSGTDSILFQIGNGGTPTRAEVTETGMEVGNANNNMSFTTNGGNINAAMDATTKAGGGFIATNDNSTALNMSSMASNDGGTTYGVSNNDLTKITTSGANSTGLLIGTETADPVIFGTNTGEAMRIDANQRVTIGRTSADAIVHVATTAADSGDNKLTMILENDEVDVTAGKGAGIEFRAVSNTTGPVITPLGGIKAVRESSVNANERGALAFTTMDGSSNVNEHVRIDSYGKVGIGSTNPSNTLEISKEAQNHGITISRTGAGAGTASIDVHTNGKLSLSSDQDIALSPSGATDALVVEETTGRVGIGQPSPNSKLEVTDTAGKQFRMNYDGSNYVELEAGSAGELSVYNNGNARMLLEADGDLGLGLTGAAAARFHLQTSVAAGDTLFRLDADDGGQVFNVTKDASDNGAITVSDTSGNTDIRFNTAGDSYIRGAGQFGIGTSSPGADLHVDNVADANGVFNDSNNGVVISSTGDQELRFWIDQTNKIAAIGSVESGVSANRALVLNPSDGNVGIGTLDPGTKLEVIDTSNTARFTASSDTDDAQASLVLRRTRSSTTNPGGDSAGDFEGTLSFELEGFPSNTYIEAANIGARWVGQQTNTGTDRDSELVFRTMLNGISSEQMIIDEDGNVGIGTTAPAEKLDVAGDVKLSGGSPRSIDVDGTLEIQSFGGNVATFRNTGVQVSAQHHINRGSTGNSASITVSRVTATDASNTGTISGFEVDVTGVSGGTVYGALVNGGNVGIGESDPEQLLHVNGVGLVELSNGTTNNSNTALIVRQKSSGDMTDGFGPNLRFEIDDTANTVQAIARIKAQRDGADNEGKLVFQAGTGGTEEFMTIRADGAIGIGTTAPAQLLEVEGSGTNYIAVDTTSASAYTGLEIRSQQAVDWYIRNNYSNSDRLDVVNGGGVGVYLTDGGTSWTSTSDERWKENWVEIDHALEKLMSLRTGTYNYIDNPDMRHVGLIAQDVDKVLPEAVDKSDEDKWGVKYTEVIPLMIAATQEQQEQLKENLRMFQTMQGRLYQVEQINKEQDRDIASLKEKVENLESENEMLKSYLCAKDPDAPFCQ
jgi:hypothetical protein